MALNRPIISEIANKTWHINEFGCDSIYVLEGTDRSLVVDVGTAFMNLREIVETLTDKPYDVVITHAHPDHIGMMRQFEKIYINKKEITQASFSQPGVEPMEGMEVINYFTRPDYHGLDDFELVNRQHVGNWEVWAPTEDIICHPDFDTKICYIKEGDSFDLGGGRTVTAYDLPGHTAGHMYFIDEGERIAFTGDCVNHNNGTRFHAASTHIKYLKKLRSMYGVKFDRIFTGHGSYGGTLNLFSQSIGVVDNLIEAHRAFLRGEAQFEESGNHLFPELPPTKKLVYGTGKTRVSVNVPN